MILSLRSKLTLDSGKLFKWLQIKFLSRSSFLRDLEGSLCICLHFFLWKVSSTIPGSTRSIPYISRLSPGLKGWLDLWMIILFSKVRSCYLYRQSYLWVIWSYIRVYRDSACSIDLIIDKLRGAGLNVWFNMLYFYWRGESASFRFHRLSLVCLL